MRQIDNKALSEIRGGELTREETCKLDFLYLGFLSNSLNEKYRTLFLNDLLGNGEKHDYLTNKLANYSLVPVYQMGVQEHPHGGVPYVTITVK